MAPSNIPKKKKANNRRRKKRRTEDFSSSSDSSSSSSSSDSSDVESSHHEQEDEQPQKLNIDINDMDIDSDSEINPNHSNSNKIPDNLSIGAKKQLNQIPFTTTSISQLTNTNQLKNINNLSEINDNLTNESKSLNNEFLKLMSTEFSQDLDTLRKKPDFNDKSLVILAKLLQSGSNMFNMDIVSGLLADESE